MRNKMYWKKIAAVMITTFMLFQSSVCMAAETAPEAPAAETVVTEAPATEAPATEAPATEAPATEAPATEAPATEAPATEASATEAPATEAPATEAPATEAATEAPATEAPVTESPATEAPKTEAPATEEPVTEAPATEAPVTESPATEETEMKEETLPSEKEETEKETEEEYQTSFRFENQDVLVAASVSKKAQFPMNTEMKVEKLQPGTKDYEDAKALIEAKSEAVEDAEYILYDVNFYVNGKKLDYAAGMVKLQMQFKTVYNTEENAESVLHIDANDQVKNVTAPSGTGSSLSSVEITL